MDVGDGSIMAPLQGAVFLGPGSRGHDPGLRSLIPLGSEYLHPQHQRNMLRGQLAHGGAIAEIRGAVHAVEIERQPPHVRLRGNLIPSHDPKQGAQPG